MDEPIENRAADPHGGWDRWLSFDPVVNWRDRVDNLKQLGGILLKPAQPDGGGKMAADAGRA